MAEEDMAAEKQNHNQTRYPTSPPRLRDRLPTLVFAMSLVKGTPLKNKKSS